MGFKITRIQRLSAVLCISSCFFIAEISVGFYTHSLALIADAFHYLNDLVGFAIALAATIIAEKGTPPKALTFGWQRIQLLGAFFNGVLLFGLGISVFLQSLERFVSLQRESELSAGYLIDCKYSFREGVEQPKLVLLMGCVGFGLNIISVLFLHGEFFFSYSSHIQVNTKCFSFLFIDHDHGHGHDHSHDESSHTPEDSASASLVNEKHIHHNHHIKITNAPSQGKNRDLAMMGVLIHVIGDCANNIGVIIAAAVIWFAKYGGRFYADPAVMSTMLILICVRQMLTNKSVKQSGLILLQSAPQGVDYDDVKDDLEKIPGILAIHELHIWRLNQEKSLASAHIVLDSDVLPDFENIAKTIRECLHEYGIHSITLQPEAYIQRQSSNSDSVEGTGANVSDESGNGATRQTSLDDSLNQCKAGCGSLCLEQTCCQ
ncbi:cation efflux protein [Penicillium angulare]|uniref:cation efflux protein n=1 Tax=Penicillium angulare TaxID=116970 RepID=UPI0025402D58|nr:cation efflux protein [Penicillium angulare]KAJ5286706.1 cation efflux protein [Penicillium angulare]